MISEQRSARLALTLFGGVLAAAGLCLTAGSAPVEDSKVRDSKSQGSGVNYAHLADLVVNRSWRLAAGERVVLFWDASRDRGMAGALRAAIGKAGGQIEEIAAPDSQRDARLTAQQKTARFEQWAAVFKRSQAAIWLPSDLTAVDDQPFEHLVEASQVRSIHFHWFLPPDAADVSAVEAMYARAIEIEPSEIARRIAALEGAMRGQTVHVSAANGTNFSFRVPADAHMHRNTGLATREKVREARSARDREEELPASVLRTTDVEDAEGTFIGYVSFDTRSGLARATLKQGRVTKLESLHGAEALVEAWKKASGDKDQPGEFVIGTNPALTPVMKSGFMPYYGYGGGVVRLAIGDNWESGGSKRSSNGEVLLFLPGATLTAGDKVLSK